MHVHGASQVEVSIRNAIDDPDRFRRLWTSCLRALNATVSVQALLWHPIHFYNPSVPVSLLIWTLKYFPLYGSMLLLNTGGGLAEDGHWVFCNIASWKFVFLQQHSTPKRAERDFDWIDPWSCLRFHALLMAELEHRIPDSQLCAFITGFASFQTLFYL